MPQALSEMLPLDITWYSIHNTFDPAGREEMLESKGRVRGGKGNFHCVHE